MLSIQSSFQPANHLNRREWLHIGALGTFGLNLPGLLQERALGASPTRRSRACIMLFLLGGPPQQETWDPKPDSAVEYRGDMKPIATATPGIFINETMTRTAKLTSRIAILRAVQTRDHSHSSSGYYMTTGRPHLPMGVENAKPGFPNDWPCLGAVVRRLKQGECTLPAAITLPEQMANDGNLTWPGQDAGFLGRTADPWLLNCDPAKSRFELPGLSLPAEVPALRFDQRKALLEQVNHHYDEFRRADGPAVYGAASQQAFDLIFSNAARKAFDLESEDPRLRDRYGRSRFGQSALLARRLVESGVPLVRVNWTRVPNAPNNGHWDTHGRNTDGVRALMPIADRAYAALLEDLAERGLLDDTLVVWASEFGRTPKLNGGGGRDHWGNVFSVALAGGGIRGGIVHGTSDKIAGYPKEGRVLPEDLQATLLHCLDIAPHTEFRDNQERPIAVTRGEVISAIL